MAKNSVLKLFTIVSYLSILSLGVSFSHLEAQTACTSQTAGKSRAQLEQELEACNQEIEQWTNTLNKTKEESASFARDVAALTAKINAAQANIKAKNIAITNLSKDIAVKQTQISILDNRINKGKQAIADILRKTNEINSYSLAETLLSDKALSEFFVDIDTYASTEVALDNLFNELRNNKALTEAEKEALNKKKEAEDAARAALEASKKQVEIANAEKKTLLAESQSKEKTYAQVLADKQAKAAQIRAVLFPLANTDQAIPFGTALQYAEIASQKTGVRAAFILAILKQETGIGANTGSCIISDISSGQTKSIKSGNIFSNGVHPLRDLSLLQHIVKDLNGNPLTTRISCPIGSVGYGGGMGPAQFIPSTWACFGGYTNSLTGTCNFPRVNGRISYEGDWSYSASKDTIRNSLGTGIQSNPWTPQEAILASALLLKGNMGVTGDRYTDERTAACRYYSGSTCYVNGSASRGLSYGNSVMGLAASIQNDIDFLNNL